MNARDLLALPEGDAIDSLLAAARVIEGRRTVRRIDDADARIFLSAVRSKPSARLRVWAGRGAFVPLKERVDTTITILEYTPADGHGPAQIVVSEGDARRPGAKGAWLEVNGQKEV